MLLKYRILNKYNILIFSLFLFGMFFTMFFDTGLDQVNPITFNAEGQGVGELSKEEQEQYRVELYNILMTYDNYAMSSINMFFLGLPILVSGTALLFNNEKRGLFVYKYTRGSSRKKVYLSTILSLSLITASTLYIAYAIYCLAGVFFCNMTPTNPGLLTLLDFIFGFGFGERNILLYFLLLGIEQVFIFAFVFSIFTYSIMLLTNKAYIATLISMAYYFVGNFVFINFGFIDLSIIRPGLTVAITGYANFDIVIQGLFPMMIPLVISTILITYSLKRGESIGG